MVDPIPPKVQKLWDEWNIRGTILFSLFMQAFLILFSPYRKCTRKQVLIILIWSGYLLADAAANFTVGLISNSQGNNSATTSKAPMENSDLLAFWAPFLLLHLGGPDTITAFALEDNELWLRHLLGLVFQAVAALHVFAQSLPKNKLWIPTILMFVAGTIKYVERTRALYLASSDRLRDSMLKLAKPGSNYAKLMEQFAIVKESKVPSKIVRTVDRPDYELSTDAAAKEGDLNDLEVVHYAYHFFSIFKKLVVDLPISFRERQESRYFFRKRRLAEEALRVIEVELNFLYDILYTKMEVVHSIKGYIFRFIAFGSILTSLLLFHFETKRQDFNLFDVRITYTLLFGAISLEIIAFLTIIFSDWTFAAIKDPDMKTGLFSASAIFRGILKLRRPWWRPSVCGKGKRSEVGDHVTQAHNVLATPILLRRWSESHSSYNLISYCLKYYPPERIHKFTSWPDIISGEIIRFLRIGGVVEFVTTIIKNIVTVLAYLINGVIQGVIHFINSVVNKLEKIPWLSSMFSKVSLFLSSNIGSSVLGEFLDEMMYVSREPLTEEMWTFIFEELKKKAEYADDVETAKNMASSRGERVLGDRVSTLFDARDLMPYVTDVEYDASLLIWHIATDICYYTSDSDVYVHNYQELSKLFSDYMLYLLIKQPTMMSAVGGVGRVRFLDTCAEAQGFLEARRRQIEDHMKNGVPITRAYCKEIKSVNTEVNL